MKNYTKTLKFNEKSLKLSTLTTKAIVNFCKIFELLSWKHMCLKRNNPIKKSKEEIQN